MYEKNIGNDPARFLIGNHFSSYCTLHGKIKGLQRAVLAIMC